MVRLAAPVLLALLLPVASAWSLSLDAPEEVPMGVPFLVRACVEEGPAGAPVEFRIWLRTEEGRAGRVLREGVPARSDRYAPSLMLDERGNGCDEVALEHAGPSGPVLMEARVRPQDGAPKARAQAAVRLGDAAIGARPANGPIEVVDAEGRVLVRVPASEGFAFLPHLVGAAGVRDDTGRVQALPSRLEPDIVEVRKDGLTVANLGAGPLPLAALHLDANGRAVRLPEGDLAPGERVHLSVQPPPDGIPHLVFTPPRLKGNLTLSAGSHPLVRVEAPALREGMAWTPDEGLVRLGRTALRRPAPMEVEGALRLYATPDAGAAPVLDLLASARREILVEGYTLTSPDVAAALLDAHARGVRVRVLLEGAPVGGIPPAQKDLTGVLVREGVEVSLLAGDGRFPARYATLHAKVAIVDREAVLVATENLHPSSYPAVARPDGTRGFGVIVRNETLAGFFAEVFEADAAPWPDVRRAPAAPADVPRPTPRAGAQAGPRLDLLGRWNVTPVLSPDAGAEGVLDVLRSARGSLDVAVLLAEPTFADGPSPLVEALLDAARRGVRIRVMLDGRLDAARNREAVELLDEVALREGLPLEARLAAPERTLHAKLVLADGARAYVGSMNWGEASALRNREAGLVLDSEEAARWYGAWFEKEWEEGGAARGREVGGPAWGAMLGLVGAAAALTPRPRAPWRARRGRTRSRRRRRAWGPSGGSGTPRGARIRPGLRG